MNLLIIEDDADIRSFLEQALHEEGFIVDTAADGDAGLRKALVNTYDIIILDYNLPCKNGKEVCSKLRTSNTTTRILMLSVKGEVLNKVDMLNIGVDDYMTKPFVFSELVARVRALLRRPEHTKETVLEVGPIMLDITRHVVTNNAKEIILTPKEFALLEYLMSHHGRIVSRMSILEHIWGVNADPFTNTIETHILNLRKKLDDKHSKSLIHTISGVGYKLS